MTAYRGKVDLKSYFDFIYLFLLWREEVFCLKAKLKQGGVPNGKS